MFCSGYFRDGVSQTICLCWPWTAILQISASQAARIVGMDFVFVFQMRVHSHKITHFFSVDQFFFLYCWAGWGNCGTYKSSYNVSNISINNLVTFAIFPVSQITTTTWSQNIFITPKQMLYPLDVLPILPDTWQPPTLELLMLEMAHK
jgi:hypothetical protein